MNSACTSRKYSTVPRRHAVSCANGYGHLVTGASSVDGAATRIAPESSTESREHPLVSYFGLSDDLWPRILVIGREADDARPVGTHTGPYELDKYPRTAFWNGAMRPSRAHATFLVGFYARSRFRLRVHASSTPTRAREVTPSASGWRIPTSRRPNS